MQQLADGAVLAGENEIWGDLTEGLKDEPALMRPRVRHLQLVRIPRLPAERDHIKIQRTRFVQYLFGAPPELLFQQLEFLQQGFRGLARQRDHGNYCVDERG